MTNQRLWTLCLICLGQRQIDGCGRKSDVGGWTTLEVGGAAQWHHETVRPRCAYQGFRWPSLGMRMTRGEEPSTGWSIQLSKPRVAAVRRDRVAQRRALHSGCYRLFDGVNSDDNSRRSPLQMPMLEPGCHEYAPRRLPSPSVHAGPPWWKTSSQGSASPEWLHAPALGASPVG